MRGGLGSLTGELARRLQVRCGVLVQRVRRERHGVVAETGDGRTFRARAVVLATPAPEALGLWSQAPEETRGFLSGQSHSQGFGVFLRTREPIRRPDPRGRDLYMEIVPRGEGTDALLGVIYLNEAAPDGGLLLLDAIPRAAAATADDTELADRLESEFAALHPELGTQVTARRTLRWRMFVPSYPAGRARELAAFRARIAPGPVQLAGDYLYGPLMEAAVRAGQEAAARAAHHLRSREPTVSP
jgi:predicted NAD/FAD-dependent oxidoreductase